MAFRPRPSTAHHTRAARVVAVTVVATVALACGSDDDGDADASSGSASETASASVGAFPVTITHAFGETTIDGPAARVVTLGAGDLAVANALGANVVGAVRNFELPYLEPEVDPSIYELSVSETGGQLNVEAIAAYEPDLILATSSNQLTQESYDTLSEIAPVVAYEEALYAAPMEDDALLIGRALGDEGGADDLIAEAQASIDALEEELPGIAGKTYLYGQARGHVIPLVIGEENQSTRFMASLGLRVPDAFADADVSDALAPGTIGLSYEEAAQLDAADVLYMTFPGDADQQMFESNPVVQGLRLVREGGYYPIELETAVALQGPNVVAVPWLLEQLRPSLEDLAAG